MILNPTQAALLDHLHAIAASAAAASAPRRYASIADYVIDRGTWEVSGALSRDQREYVAGATGGALHERGACFANAQRLAVDHERLAYREGYAVAGTGLVVLHAWCVLDGARVVDVTWRTRFGRSGRRIRGTLPPGFAYLGTSPARRDDLWPRAASLGGWYSFLDAIAEGYPLLDEPRLPR